MLFRSRKTRTVAGDVDDHRSEDDRPVARVKTDAIVGQLAASVEREEVKCHGGENQRCRHSRDREAGDATPTGFVDNPEGDECKDKAGKGALGSCREGSEGGRNELGQGNH